MNLKIDSFIPTFTPINRQSTHEKTEETAQKAKTDSFTPSEQAEKALRNAEEELSMLEQMLGSSKEQSEASAESFDDFAKCMKIAARIMNGDFVPVKDHKFLSEKYPEIYEQAILMRRVNPEPKKYKSLVDDDEDPNDTDYTTENTAEAAQITEAAEATASETAETATE